MFLDKLLSKLTPGKFPAPGGAQMSIADMVAKASKYSYRFDDSMDLSDLDCALEYTKAVVEAAESINHPSLASYLQSLSLFYHHRFLLAGDQSALNASLQYIKASVEGAPAGDPSLPERHGILARAYSLMFREFDDLRALELALEQYHLAVDTTPADDAAAILDRKNDLSVAYSDRFARLRERGDLDKALEYDLSIVATVSSNNPELPRYQQALAASYSAYFDTYETLDALESAIHWSRLAVENTPADDTEMPFRQESLSVVLTRHFNIFGDMDIILSAIACAKLALDTTPVGSPAHAHRQIVLALAYSNLYRRSGSLMDLEKAIELERSASEVTPAEHPKYPSRLFNLAISLTARYRRLEDIQDLESALKYNMVALQKVPMDHSELSQFKRTLALSYMERFKHLKDTADIDYAMSLMEDALAGIPDDEPTHRADCLKSLSHCYKTRFDILKTGNDLDTAIELVKESLEPSYDSQEGLHLLGLLYFHHFNIHEEPQSLDLSIQFSLKALEITQESDGTYSIIHQNLGVTNAYKFRRLKDPEYLQASLIHLRKSADFSRSPGSSWVATMFWGEFALECGLEESLEVYSLAFKNLFQLIWIGNSISVRHDLLRKYKISNVSGDATAAAVIYNKPQLAAEFLNQGLAITYRQVLGLRDNASGLNELAQKFPEKANRLREISQYLQQAESSFATRIEESQIQTQHYHLLALERNDLIEEVQKLPGMENLFKPMSFQALLVAAQEGPIIMLNCTKYRSDAIILLSKIPYVIVVPLPQVHPDAAARVMQKLKDALSLTRTSSRSPSEMKPDRHGAKFRPATVNSQKLFSEVISWLETAVVDLVLNALKENNIYSGRIWWCPSGDFTYLPLHAARIDSHYIQSYTSTLEALIQARLKICESGQGPSLTTLGVSSLPGQPHLNLPAVDTELARITTAAGPNNVFHLDGQEAKLDQVLEVIQNAKWLHLACHGEQDVAPLESGLLLPDGKLQLGQILTKNLPNAQFVFLSACQTAMGDVHLSNESMHLAGGFIAAGFRGAIGTLWSIADSDGPLIADIFYKQIFSGKNPNLDVTLTAEALSNAVKQLKASGASFERWMPFVHFGI